MNGAVLVWDPALIRGNMVYILVVCFRAVRNRLSAQSHPIPPTPIHSYPLPSTHTHCHPLPPTLINSLSFLPTPNYFHQPFSSLFLRILPRSIFKIWEAAIFKEHLSVVICENRKNSRNFFKTQTLQSSVVLKDNCSKLEVKIFENICK